jgi:formylglycine-generating enzyme required for sulfatase activity
MKSIKNIISVIIGVVLLSGLFSCSKFDDTDEYEHFQQPNRISALQGLIELGVDGAAKETVISVSGANTDWSYNTKAEWLTIKKSTTEAYSKTEQTLIIQATPNTFYARQDTVFLTLQSGQGVVKKYIVVKQLSALPNPAVSTGVTVLNFGSSEGTLNTTVTTNQSVVTFVPDQPWITAVLTGGTLKVTVQRNTTAAARSGKIVLTAGTAPHLATANLQVNQAMPDNGEQITIGGIELMLVEKGTFYMGAQNTDPAGPNYNSTAAANQAPVHRVTLTKDFYMGKFQVTQQQYEAIMNINPSTTKGANHPVEMVDYNKAKEFVEKLSVKTGKNFRLPTEAEWEYAARGGKKSKGYMYSGSNDPGAVAYYFATDEREKAVTVPVGTKLPNELGIYDMSGNVYEWCNDFFQTFTSSDKTDPVGVGTNRIIRGGSWYHNAASQTVFYRGNNVDSFTRAYLGLRVIYIPN